MIVRALTSDGDWTRGRGLAGFRTENDAIAQKLQTRINFFLGDCFFALTLGIDWFTLLGGKNLLALDIALRTTIVNTQGVTGIVSFSIVLDPTTRKATISYAVTTVYLGIPLSSVISLLLDADGDILTTDTGEPLIA